MTIWQGERRNNNGVSEQPRKQVSSCSIVKHIIAQSTKVKQYCMVVLSYMIQQCGDSCLWVLKIWIPKIWTHYRFTTGSTHQPATITTTKKRDFLQVLHSTGFVSLPFASKLQYTLNLLTIASQSTFKKMKEKYSEQLYCKKKKKVSFSYNRDTTTNKTTIYEKSLTVLFMLHMYKKALKLQIHLYISSLRVSCPLSIDCKSPVSSHTRQRSTSISIPRFVGESCSCRSLLQKMKSQKSPFVQDLYTRATLYPRFFPRPW